MPSNRTKYSEEFRKETAAYIIESGKAATSISELLGTDTNTVCRWVREYRRKNNLPTYAEEKGLKAREPKSETELKLKIKELEKQIKEKNKEIEKQKKKLADERENVEILKKSLHIFMLPQG